MRTRAAWQALGAAALFGLSPPLAKRLGLDASPLVSAALLYGGAGIALVIALAARRLQGRAQAEAPLVWADVPTLTALVVVGGLAAPLLLLDGLAHTAASSASLLLNLELPLTALIAVFLFREHLSGREWFGTALVAAGAAWLTVRASTGDGLASLRGELSVAGACALWALDTNLTQRLSTRDPRAVVAVKGLGAAGVGALAALVVHARAPGFATAWRGVLLGAASYGASLLLYVHALRDLGAAPSGGPVRDRAVRGGAGGADAVAGTPEPCPRRSRAGHGGRGGADRPRTARSRARARRARARAPSRPRRAPSARAPR
jgi:drug/metabolite transporter (DMT)-like permease